MILQRINVIRELYLRDRRPWIIAFSGGKDSTATLQLVWLAVSSLVCDSRTKPIYVAYVDTGMEHPAFSTQITETLDKIQRTADAHSLPISTVRLQPQIKYRYFVAVIGRGYAPPTAWFRWCTSKMRIQPMTRFIKSKISESGEVVIVLGLRRAESLARRETLSKYATPEPFISHYGSLSDALAFTPIEDFGTNDVWQFLMQSPCPWTSNHRALAGLYSAASGGECPSYSLGEGMAPTCGGSRFGCWTCTVVRKDKAGLGLSQDNESYEKLLEFRNWLAVIRYDRNRRWKRRRNGAPGPGPLTLGARREILCRVSDLQAQTRLPLLRWDEVLEIQKFWTLDGDRHQSAISIFSGDTSTS